MATIRIMVETLSSAPCCSFGDQIKMWIGLLYSTLVVQKKSWYLGSENSQKSYSYCSKSMSKTSDDSVQGRYQSQKDPRVVQNQYLSIMFLQWFIFIYLYWKIPLYWCQQYQAFCFQTHLSFALNWIKLSHHTSLLYNSQL